MTPVEEIETLTKIVEETSIGWTEWLMEVNHGLKMARLQITEDPDDARDILTILENSVKTRINNL